MLLSVASIAFVINAGGCTQLPKMSLPSALSNASLLTRSDRAANAASHLDGNLSLGRLAERRGNNTRAKEIFKAILKQTPGHRQANHRLAVIAAREGQLEKSLEYFRVAQAGDGQDSAELLGDLGYIEYLMGNLEAAEISLSKSLDIEPTNERTLNNLGLVMGMMGKTRESFSYFEQAVGKAEAHANLAYVLSQRGTEADIQQAANHYHQALESDSELRIAAHALMQIQQRLPQRNQMPEREMQLASSGNNDWRQQVASVLPQMTKETLASNQTVQQPTTSPEAATPETTLPKTARTETVVYNDTRPAEVTHINIERGESQPSPVNGNEIFNQLAQANSEEEQTTTQPFALVSHHSPITPEPVSSPTEPARLVQPAIKPYLPITTRRTTHPALPVKPLPVNNNDTHSETSNPRENATEAIAEEAFVKEAIVEESIEPSEPIVVVGSSFSRPLAFDL